MQIADLSLRTFAGLSDLLSPLYYNNLKPIPPREPGEPGIAKTLTFRSYTSKDARWGYMYNGATLKCFPILSQSPELKSSRYQSQLVLNTKTYYFQNSIITCATELTLNSSRSCGVSKLLIGLNCGAGGGALVIYDPIAGEPVKWIATPAAVSSVIVISNSEESGYTRPFFSEAMVAMVGIAAVGFYGGHLYLIDLGLNDLDDGSSHSHREDAKMYKLTSVEPHQEYVAPKRKSASAKKLLICVDFKNQDEFSDLADYDSNTFYYSVGGEEVVKIAKENVCVACLEYVPVIGSIVVGYNFGGFQIYRVDSTSLEYTSALSPSRTPVHSICYQLPVDDPKNFCYLWVLYGTAIIEMQMASATFYALFYEAKEESEQFGPTFHILQSCIPRLSFDLQDFYVPGDENASFEEDEGSLDSTSIQRFAVRPLRMWSQTDNLVFFTWECTRNDAYILGIFDLNQWYSAQTPVRLNCVAENQVNPFWTAINFTIPFAVERGPVPAIYDLQIIPKTLERWENPHNNLDVHLFPASLTFQAVCVSSIGTFVFEHFGIQEKLLRLIQKDGYHLLSEPAMLRQLCESYGVTPFLLHNSGEEMNEIDCDRFFVFTALLENRRPSLIIQIANRWIDGAFANLGCTLDLILRWAKGYNHTLRLYVDDHWTELLSNRRDVTPETTHCLNYSNFMWNQINGLLMTLARHNEVYDNVVRNDEVEHLQFALNKLIPYSAALLMLNRAGILPPTNKFDVMMLLQKMCSERRTNVRKELLACAFLEPEHRYIPQLLIDSLLIMFQEICLKSDWDFEQENFLYPPSHPIMIFNMLLGKWTTAEMKVISRIIFYFILDITHLLDLSELTTPQSTLRGDFSSILKLTMDEQNEVLHLWYIDHGEFEKALLFLCNGDRMNTSNDLPWTNACVLLAAQGCEEPVLHILKHFCFPKAGKLYTNLLCLNDSTFSAALSDLLLSDIFSYDKDALFHCLEALENKGLLPDFIISKSRHAPFRVQEGLVAYIRKQPSSYTNDSQLLLLYMMIKDDSSAEEHFERMKAHWENSRSLLRRDQEDWAKMKAQMESYVSSRRGNFIMNFLGYEQEHVRAIRPAPLKLEAKVIASTPIRNVHPQLKRLASNAFQSKEGFPHSPLRHFSPKQSVVSELEPPTTPVVESVAQNPPTPSARSRVDLDVLLRTPKINSRPLPTEETEDFSTPTGVHGILRQRNASSSKMEDADLSVRFLTDQGIVAVGSHSESNHSENSTEDEEMVEAEDDTNLPDRTDEEHSIVSENIETTSPTETFPQSKAQEREHDEEMVEAEDDANPPDRTEEHSIITENVETTAPTETLSQNKAPEREHGEEMVEAEDDTNPPDGPEEHSIITENVETTAPTETLSQNKAPEREHGEEMVEAEDDTNPPDGPEEHSIITENVETTAPTETLSQNKAPEHEHGEEMVKAKDDTNPPDGPAEHSIITENVETTAPTETLSQNKAPEHEHGEEMVEAKDDTNPPDGPAEHSIITENVETTARTEILSQNKAPEHEHGEEMVEAEDDTNLPDGPEEHSIITENVETTARTETETFSQNKAPEHEHDEETVEERTGTSKRRVTRSLSKQLGLDESIHSMSLGNSLLNTSRESPRRHRSTRTVFGFAPDLSVVPEATDSLSLISAATIKEEDETPDPSFLAATIVEEKPKKRVRSKRVKPEPPEEDNEDAKSTTSSTKSKKSARSAIKDEDETPDPSFLAATIVEEKPKKRVRSKRVKPEPPEEDNEDAKSTTSSTKSKKSARSAIKEEDETPDPSFLAVTIVEEKPKKRVRSKRVKPEPAEEDNEDAKSTTSSTKSGKSARSSSVDPGSSSVTTTTPTRRSKRSRSATKDQDQQDFVYYK